MTFEDVIRECLKTDEFVEGFNRLTGCQLLVDERSPIIRMIDEATGYQVEIDKQQRVYLRQFISFVFEVVWLPLLSQTTKP